MRNRQTQSRAASWPVNREPQPVTFTFNQPQAQSVAVAGTFNDWDPKRTPMRKDAKGNWHTTVTLMPGRYEYRFVVEGQWISDPHAKESVQNPLGSTNSVCSV
jgi:1,4-alpha-glucan branching enzyme